MIVADLIDRLRKMPKDWDVIITDGNSEYDVVITTDTDKNLGPCVVIDLTADCLRGE